MAATVIHFGWDDCYRVQVLRFAGYEVRDPQSLETLAIELERADQIDAVVLSEDDLGTLQKSVDLVRRHSAAPLILFRRSRRRIDESAFDRVFTWLVRPEAWLSETAELIAMNRALPKEMEQAGVNIEPTRFTATATRREEKPAVFDRVTVRGRGGVYLAFRINQDRESADLVRLMGKHRIERGVSIALLERVPEAPRWAH
jgi:hypothetical protein